jgi:rubrerythrin
MSGKERRELERKIEALVIAIPRETEAYEFYMELSREYDDAASKEMFVFLANQEELHRQKLEKLLARLEEQLIRMPK